MTTVWAFPSLDYWIFVFPVGVGIGVLAGQIAGRLRAIHQWPVGYTRKVFHFLIFTCAGGIGVLGGFPAVQVYGASIGVVVFYSVYQGKQSLLFNAVARPGDAPHERFYIIVPFCMTALGGMLSNLLFGTFAIIGYITTGWGDAIAEPIGTRYGKHKYRVASFMGIEVHRSIEGSMAVLVASYIGCVLVLMIGYDYTVMKIIWTSFVISITAMLVEAVTFHSMDNLTIQVVTSGVGFYLLS